MKEMCSDFIPDMADMMSAGEEKVCGNSLTGDASDHKNNSKIVGEERKSMSQNRMMDCNACVIEAIGLAQAFVPFQPDGVPMGLEQSLICGTAFAGLVKPYVKGSSFLR